MHAQAWLLAVVFAKDEFLRLPGQEQDTRFPANNQTKARRLFDAENKVETVRMYGGVHEYAYWFIDILIGDPPQRASVIVDTGSVLCGFPCSGCKTCGHHIDQAFKWEVSKSFQWTRCKDRASGCTCGNDGICHYFQSYTEGSSIGGKLFSDFVRVGDALQHNPATRAQMGCHQTETKLFVSQKANGIMGLATSDQSAKPSILQNLFNAVDASVFSMCLAQFGGELLVGGSESYYQTIAPTLAWLKPITMRGVYAVSLLDLTIDEAGVKHSGGFGRTIIDSGTTFTYFPSGIYRSIRSKLTQFCKRKRLPCTQSCFMLDETRLGELPTIKMTLDSVKVNWTPQAYLYPTGGRKYCFGFDDNGRHGGSVLGATWMVNHRIVFDIKRNRIGIADATCPEYKERPGPPTASDFAKTTPPIATSAPVTVRPPVRVPPSVAPSVAPSVEPSMALSVAPGVAPVVAPSVTPPPKHTPSGTDPRENIILVNGVELPWYASIVAPLAAAFLLCVAWVNLCRWCVRRRVAIDAVPLEDWFATDVGREDIVCNSDSEFAIDDDGMGVGNDIYLGDSDIDTV